MALFQDYLRNKLNIPPAGQPPVKQAEPSWGQKALTTAMSALPGGQVFGNPLVQKQVSNVFNTAKPFVNKVLNTKFMPGQKMTIAQGAQKAFTDTTSRINPVVNKIGSTIGKAPVQLPFQPITPYKQPNLLQTVKKITPLIGGEADSPASSFLSGQVEKIPGQLNMVAKKTADSFNDPKKLPQTVISGMMFGGGGESKKSVNKALIKAKDDFGRKLTPFLESQGVLNVRNNLDDYVERFSKAFSNKNITGNQQYDDLVKLATFIKLQKEGVLSNAPSIGLSMRDVSKGKIGTQIEPKLLGPGNPEQRAIEAIKKMKPLRDTQEKMYTAERSQRIQSALKAESEAGGGLKGFEAKMSQMGGAMEKVQHESIRKWVSDSDIDSLLNKIKENTVLTDFEKIPAQKALLNLFNEKGAKIPTESELIKLKQVFNPELVDALMDNRTMGQKIYDKAVDVLNLPRSVMSSLDLSAPLRQGIVPAATHPKDFARSFKKMFGYATSEKKYQNLFKEIQSRPTYSLMKDNGLAITDMGSHTAREEAFMSNMAEQIPVIGRLVRASSRAYSGFLTNFRADLFDALHKNGAALCKGDDPKYLKSLTNFINTATGRGDPKDLGGKALANASDLLNGLFFSPRLIASRVNMLRPDYYARLEPTVRKEAMKTMAIFMGTGMSILGAAKLAGAEVSTEPTSADFGKIKIGNTRYDIWGGFQPYVTFLARMLTGKYTSTTTGKETKYGNKFGQKNRWDATMKFAEGKMAPLASFTVDAIRGQDFEYNKFDLTETDPFKNPIMKRILPLMANDFKDKWEEYGAVGPVLSLPGFFGIGSSTYGTQNKVKYKPRIGTSIQ